VVGGCPHIEDDPLAAADHALGTAGELGRMLDLHTDETLDPSHLGLRYLAGRVRTTGFERQATASHCVSLGIQPPDVQRATSYEVAAAGVSVITLPQTNLFLQGRLHPTSAPRGLTALRPLIDAGATLGAGADNVRDPFCSMGRSDPFETAALLVMAGHLLPDEAYHAITDGARIGMGLPAVRIEPGAPAELVAVVGTSVADAIARADQQRMTWHRGRLVSSTTVARRMLPAD
jgi:cytosine deaminase